MMFITLTPGECADCEELFDAGTEVTHNVDGQTVGAECGCGVEYLTDDEAEQYMRNGWATRV